MAWYHNGRKYWYHNGKRYSKRTKYRRKNNNNSWLSFKIPKIKEFFTNLKLSNDTDYKNNPYYKKISDEEYENSFKELYKQDLKYEKDYNNYFNEIENNYEEKNNKLWKNAEKEYYTKWNNKYKKGIASESWQKDKKYCLNNLDSPVVKEWAKIKGWI